jgi:hypothetical protein
LWRAASKRSVRFFNSSVLIYDEFCTLYDSRRFVINEAFMDPKSSKIFTVLVRNCENPAHARKISELLRASFPHTPERVTTDISFAVMVKADSIDSIRNVISPVLGKARAVFAFDHAWFENGKTSTEPPPYVRFEPPTPLRDSLT